MKLLNDLRKLSIEDYNNCIDFIVENLSEHNFINSVFQFGTIKSPGISDLDIMVVVNSLEDYKNKKNIIENIINSAPNADYCFHHGPIIICENDIKYLCFFHSTENLRCLWGNDLSEEKIEYKFGKTQILNWNAFFYVTCLDMLFWEHAFSQRFFLLIINNLAMSIKNNDSLFNTSYYQDFKDKVDSLRVKCIEDLAGDYSLEANELLNRGIKIIQKQEITQNDGFGFDIIFEKDKKIFISSKKLDIKRIKRHTFYLLPKRYFKARKEFLKEVKKIFPNDKNFNEFFKMRGRFTGFKIIGLEN